MKRKNRLPHGVVLKLRAGTGVGTHRLKKGKGSYKRKKLSYRHFAQVD